MLPTDLVLLLIIPLIPKAISNNYSMMQVQKFLPIASEDWEDTIVHKTEAYEVILIYILVDLTKIYL